MPYIKTTSLSDIQATLDDPCASYWIKGALRTALDRDPVDAANDAACLAELLAARAEHIGALSI